MNDPLAIEVEAEVEVGVAIDVATPLTDLPQ